MNIIIAGGGKVGFTLVRQLSTEGHDLTLIDTNQTTLESAVERYDVMAIRGNCASMETLLEAGVMDADLVIAVTGADELNLLCCLTSHGLNDKLHTIARIRNPEYAQQIHRMRELFALSMIVNPERQAAAEIERLIKYPGFLKRESFAKGRLEIVELRLEAGSPLCNLSLSQMNEFLRCKVLVCAVIRNGESVTPGGYFVLREGDRLFVTAPTNNLAVLLKSMNIEIRKVSKVIIAGGGRASFYLAQRLQHSGISVHLIEKEEERCLQLAEMLPDISVIYGDASDMSLLESEGLDQCDAMVALTGFDETNIIMSLYAKSHGVPQVITKVGRMDSTIRNTLSLDSVISPRELCSNAIVQYVRALQNQSGAALSVHSIADGQAEAIEFRVELDTLHCNEPLKKIRLRRNILIAGISRRGRVEIPNGESSYLPGDSLVIVTSGDTVIHQLNDIFI